MSTPPTLHPVAEAYRFPGGPPWAWSLTPDDTFVRIPLSGETTLAEVGAIAATEVYNAQLEQGPTIADWLDALIGYAPFSIHGGVVAGDAEREVGPRCCCSVSSWREWQRFLADGTSPWMGHDPTGWAEWDGDMARVWKDGGYHRTPDVFAIAFPRERFAAELAGVELKLTGFLNRVEEWAAAIGYGDPAAVRRAFAVSIGFER